MNDITNLWEENDLTELTTKSENNGIIVLNDIINETKNESVKNECEDIGKKKIWKRNCPKCGKESTYYIKRSFNDANNKNRLCRSCSQYTDVTGKVFGYLTAVKKVSSAGKYRYLNSVWLFRCICGKEVTKFIHSVKGGHGDNCGCKRSEKKLNTLGIVEYEWLYIRLKRTCDIRKTKLNISFKEFLQYTKTNQCHYCNSTIIWSKYSSDCGKKPKNYGYHLDRKNANLPYNRENCVVCCNRCNFGKSNLFSYEEWYGMTEYLRNKK